MPCKIIFLRQVTFLWSLALTTVFCLCGPIVSAQLKDTSQRGIPGVLKPMEPAKKLLQEAISEAELHKYNTIVESINKRKLFLKQFATRDSALAGIVNSTLGTSAFGSMKDSVMGEFLHYVGNNFGKERVGKIVKSFAASGDSGSLQNFIGKKLKGFYAIKGKEAFDIPSFNNLLNNDFKGARYSVVKDNTAAAPSAWIHQWQVADDVRLMDVPFHIEFSNLSDSYVPLRYNNLVKFSFDKDAFRQGVKQKLDKYYDLEKYLLHDIDMLSYVKKHFEQELATQVGGLKSSLIEDPKAMLLSKISYDELLKLDMNQVKEKIMPAAKVQPLRDQIAAYEEVIVKQGQSMLPAQKDSLIQLVKDKAGYLASLEQMVAKVGDAKNKLSASGINANQITKLQQSANAQTLKNLSPIIWRT